MCHTNLERITSVVLTWLFVIYPLPSRQYGMGKNKRLYRSKKNSVFSGVCGGLGEYFDVEPNTLRIMWVLVVLFTGFFPGLFAYLVAAYFIPKEKA